MPAGTSTDLHSWLAAIARLTTAVNTGHDLRSMLDLVAVTARELLDLDFCGVMVPTSDGTSLALAGASGLPEEYVALVNESRRIRLDSDPAVGAPASRAYRSGSYCAVSDVAKQSTDGWTDVALEQGYRSILAVPLKARDGVVGTLNSYRVEPHRFAEVEIEQLELLAEHAAMALSTARILTDLREQHRLIVRSQEVHQRLLGVAIRSGGVLGIAQALNDLLGCEVEIRDLHGEVLAATSRSEDRAPRLGASSTLGVSPGSDLLHEESRHVTVDVVLDNLVVATVWLLDQAGRLDSLGRRAAEHASVVLSMELLRHRTAVEVEQSLRGELLTDMITGADPRSSSIRDRAQLMGHDLGVAHDMFVASVSGRAERSAADLAQRTALEAVRRTSTLKPRPIIAAVREHLVALWPTVGVDPSGAHLLRRAARAVDEDATVDVAAIRNATDGLPRAFQVAQGILALRDKQPGPSVWSVDDLGVAGILLQHAEPNELRRYAARILGPVVEYDDTHGTDLMATLRVHLDAELDRRATAEALVVHPNTVSQRLRRVEALAKIDFRSPRSVLEARTAVTLLDVAGAIQDASTTSNP